MQFCIDLKECGMYGCFFGYLPTYEKITDEFTEEAYYVIMI